MLEIPATYPVGPHEVKIDSELQIVLRDGISVEWTYLAPNKPDNGCYTDSAVRFRDEAGNRICVRANMPELNTIYKQLGIMMEEWAAGGNVNRLDKGEPQ